MKEIFFHSYSTKILFNNSDADPGMAIKNTAAINVFLYPIWCSSWYLLNKVINLVTLQRKEMALQCFLLLFV